MIYSNLEFLLLLLPTVILYHLARANLFRYALLMLSSLIFYAWAGVFDSLVFVSVVLVSWFSTWLARNFPTRRELFVWTGIAILAGHLVLWKYAPWIVSEVQRVFPSLLGGERLTLALPIGISFFTLQGIAYMIDFKRGRVKYIRFADYALFKSFFAQLVAGPICRTSQLLPQIERLDRARASDFSAGISLFALGFFKKLVLADSVAPFVDRVFASPELYSRSALVLGLLGYTVQIWADFSGYTDMGRGSARLLGFTLPENFLSPYLSRTPSEFWRRWHITLSQWIRDYIYIPLGDRFPRNGFVGAAMITMLISGLWHGASWCFVVWGFYHGLLLWMQRRLTGSILDRSARRLPRPLFEGGRWCLMFSTVVFGWLIFRSHSVSAIGVYLSSLVSGLGRDATPPEAGWILAALAIAAFIQVLGYGDLKTGRRPAVELLMNRVASLDAAARGLPSVLAGLAVAALLSAALLLRPQTASKAFIYFQF